VIEKDQVKNIKENEFDQIKEEMVKRFEELRKKGSIVTEI